MKNKSTSRGSTCSFPKSAAFFWKTRPRSSSASRRASTLFFSRRIGLSESGEPIGILAGARMTGRAGASQIGLLNMQTETTFDSRTGELIAPANNYTVLRLKRDVYRRSDVGGIFVNRIATGDAAGTDNYNRAYGVDANLALSENGKLFTFVARSDSPDPVGSDYSGRVLYDYRNSLWNLRAGYTQVGERFNAEVGFVPRVGYRRPELRFEWTPQIPSIDWIRQLSPHVLVQRFYGFDGEIQTALGHYDFEVNLENGGQFGALLERRTDHPLVPFTIFQGRDGNRVVIPPGIYTWNEWMPLLPKRSERYRFRRLHRGLWIVLRWDVQAF